MATAAVAPRDIGFIITTMAVGLTCGATRDAVEQHEMQQQVFVVFVYS